MATDREALLLQIEANLKDYERELARANKVTVSALRKIERDAQQSTARLERVLGGAGAKFKSLLAGVTFAAAARGIGAVVNEMADLGEIAGRIDLPVEQLQAIQRNGIVTGATIEQVNKALQSLAEQAATSGSALEKLFAANGLSLRDAQGNLRPMVEIARQFFDILQKTSSAQERLAILTKITGDRVGRELVESFSKGAAGIDATMTDMEKRGILHSQKQIEEAAKIRDAYKSYTDLIVRYWQTMVAKLIESTGVFETDQIKVLQRQLEIRKKLLEEAITVSAGGGLAGGLSAVPGLNALGAAYQQYESSRLSTLQVEVKAIETAIEDLQSLQRELARGQAMSPGGSTVIKPLVEADMGMGKGKGKKTSTGPKSRGLDAFQREVDQVAEMIRGYQLAAQTVGLTAGEVEKLETQFSLLNAAQKANVEITPEVSALIAQLATEAGKGAQKVEDAQKRYERINEINSELRGEFSTFFTDLANGVKPIDALTAALGRLQQKLIDLALNSVFNNLFGGNAAGGGIGGFITSLFQTAHTGGIAGHGGSRKAVNPMVFAGAPRFHKGGLVPGEVPAILKAGEGVFTPAQMRALGRGNGGANVDVQIINNTGERVQQRRQQGPNGQQLVEIIVGEVKRQMGNGQFDGPMGGRWGLKPTARRV